jgi:hypothetical protein
MKVPKPGESQFSIHPSTSQSGPEDKPSASASTETAQAGPVSAPLEAGNPPPSNVSVPSQDPAPDPQPKPDVNK